jgi:Flp pilus assembly protein TadG
MHHRIRKIKNTRRSHRLHWLNRFRRDDRGLQLVEVAIVVPILLLLFGAVAEFGRYFYEYTTAAKAARVGARYLASKSVESSVNYQANAKNLVVYGNIAGTGTPILPGMTANNVDIQYVGGTTGVPDLVQVNIINYQHQSVIDLGKLLTSSASLNINVKPSVTLVEFAIGVTVFVTAMFAVLEFGRALWVHNALADAARRGARYAVLHSAADVDQVKNVVVYGDPAGGSQPMLNNLTTSNVNVTYNGFGLNQGTVSVSIINYQFQFVVPFIGTTITMPSYSTTLTAESAGLIPANI